MHMSDGTHMPQSHDYSHASDHSAQQLYILRSNLNTYTHATGHTVDIKGLVLKTSAYRPF